MLVAHLGGRQLRIDDAGDVDNARPFGEELGLARQVVVEGVVDELVARLATHRLDHRDGLALVTERRGGEAEGLDESNQVCAGYHGQDTREGIPKTVQPGFIRL